MKRPIGSGSYFSFSDYSFLTDADELDEDDSESSLSFLSSILLSYSFRSNFNLNPCNFSIVSITS